MKTLESLTFNNAYDIIHTVMTNQDNNATTKNYAYIDSQNLNMTIQNLGWNVDWAKFREYLYVKHQVTVAYLFIGYIAENQELYSFLQKAGFVIIFKPVVIGKEGNVKGNIDAELVLQVMIDQQQYAKAVIVTGDGDFHGLLNYLYSQNKLEVLLVPNMRQYSQLLKGAARDKIEFISEMRRELEYKKRPSAARTSSIANGSSNSTNGTGRTVPAENASTPPGSAVSNNSPSGNSRGRSRRGAAGLEDALLKTIDNGHKEPITTDNGAISAPPVDKPATPTISKSEPKPIEPKS